MLYFNLYRNYFLHSLIIIYWVISFPNSLILCGGLNFFCFFRTWGVHFRCQHLRSDRWKLPKSWSACGRRIAQLRSDQEESEVKLKIVKTMWKKILFFPKSFEKPHFDIKQIFLGVGYSMTIRFDCKDGIGYLQKFRSPNIPYLDI